MSFLNLVGLSSNSGPRASHFRTGGPFKTGALKLPDGILAAGNDYGGSGILEVNSAANSVSPKKSDIPGKTVSALATTAVFLGQQAGMFREKELAHLHANR
ncbi:unnamed protein product [Protopolystoma xenopodis]|uniref:Uncharacterized protein n=1 Tax=Protopolystoma xenopodis TaxID=117903 RepID=A0A3S5CQT4_9PLAT|nr:unnamed protein product [Protopolystoma xenopodis]